MDTGARRETCHGEFGCLVLFCRLAWSHCLLLCYCCASIAIASRTLWLHESELLPCFAKEFGPVNRLRCLLRWRGTLALVGRSCLHLDLWHLCRDRHGVTITCLRASLHSPIAIALLQSPVSLVGSCLCWLLLFLLLSAVPRPCGSGRLTMPSRRLVVARPSDSSRSSDRSLDRLDVRLRSYLLTCCFVRTSVLKGLGPCCCRDGCHERCCPAFVLVSGLGDRSRLIAFRGHLFVLGGALSVPLVVQRIPRLASKPCIACAASCGLVLSAMMFLVLVRRMPPPLLDPCGRFFVPPVVSSSPFALWLPRQTIAPPDLGLDLGRFRSFVFLAAPSIVRWRCIS